MLTFYEYESPCGRYVVRSADAAKAAYQMNKHKASCLACKKEAEQTKKCTD